MRPAGYRSWIVTSRTSSTQSAQSGLLLIILVLSAGARQNCPTMDRREKSIHSRCAPRDPEKSIVSNGRRRLSGVMRCRVGYLRATYIQAVVKRLETTVDSPYKPAVTCG